MLEKVPQNLIFQSFPEISLKFPQNFGIHTNFFQDILITNFQICQTQSPALTRLSEYYGKIYDNFRFSVQILAKVIINFLDFSIFPFFRNIYREVGR